MNALTAMKQAKRTPLIGDKYGRLTVVAFAFVKEQRKYWNCSCECGGASVVSSSTLNSGNTKSCGCLFSDGVHDFGKTHGKKHTREYKAWCRMKNRCNNKTATGYEHYGGRGITYCDRWEEFENFYADMGDCLSGMTLDRINSNGNYEMANCRWASQKEQTRNRRLTLKWDGKPLAEIAEQAGMNYMTIYSRFKKHGTPFPNHLGARHD